MWIERNKERNLYIFSFAFWEEFSYPFILFFEEKVDDISISSGLCCINHWIIVLLLHCPWDCLGYGSIQSRSFFSPLLDIICFPLNVSFLLVVRFVSSGMNRNSQICFPPPFGFHPSIFFNFSRKELSISSVSSLSKKSEYFIYLFLYCLY